MDIARRICSLILLALPVGSINGQVESSSRITSEPRWLAGDHHIHSRYSVSYDRAVDPPVPIIGTDAIYPIPMNGLMAKHYGLSWTVATDHGGPLHSKINLERAYPELLQSRAVLPELVQFYGMELNTPGADHSSLIVPHSHDEANHLHQLESSFDRNETWPPDPNRDQQALMLEALKLMDSFSLKPVVIANHPSRSATGLGNYGRDDPAELRSWNNTAPDVAVGMAGAPGHQAATLSDRVNAPRGAYRGYPTLGGFDQMTAIVGGFWDSMLAEGRRWWITANSDSHIHYSEGGVDFWPGEYSKTYVLAEKNHASILDGIRSGRVFVTLGDLISELSVELTAQGKQANIGGELDLAQPGNITVIITLKDPAGENHNADMPELNRVDLIVGTITGTHLNPATDYTESTRVVKRFNDTQWQRDGESITMSHTISVNQSSYVRVRGTNTSQIEPEPDTRNESPWDDLWFYSNPVFVQFSN